MKKSFHEVGDTVVTGRRERHILEQGNRNQRRKASKCRITPKSKRRAVKRGLECL